METIVFLPKSSSNTITKLTQLRQQPDELNKQVFALLLMNRFIEWNTFIVKQVVNSVASIARESASILSQQLNNLAGNSQWCGT
jgi:hypothetical protein